MSNNTEATNLPLSDIKVDPACQARADGLDPTAVDEYAEAMKGKGYHRFPPVVVFYDETNYWLSEGFHRHAAAKKAGLTTLRARIRQGTKRDAVLHSVGSNSNHGLRRSNRDKRRAVTILLEDEEWSSWSNREIARRCAVDEGLVRKVKEELGLSPSASADNPQIPRTVKRNDTVYEMKTENIGKRDGLDEVLSVKPDRDVQLDQPWIVKPDTGTAEQDTAEDIADAELGPVSDPEDVELQQLLSAWDRASKEVQRQFLATIGVSLDRQVEAAPRLAEAASSMEPELSPAAEASSKELPRSNPLFDMWKIFKPVTRADGLRWIADSCPSVYRDTHFKCTESLAPFRQAAKEATPEEQAAFLELARAYQAEDQYS